MFGVLHDEVPSPSIGRAERRQAQAAAAAAAAAGTGTAGAGANGPTAAETAARRRAAAATRRRNTAAQVLVSASTNADALMLPAAGVAATGAVPGELMYIIRCYQLHALYCVTIAVFFSLI
jgi:hypothetical protein